MKALLLTDASRIAQFCPTCVDYSYWAWHHPLAQPVLVAALAACVFWFILGRKLVECGRNWLVRNTILLEGKYMRPERQRETDSDVADVVFDSLRKLHEDKKLTDEEYKYYEEKFGNLTPLRDLLPKGSTNTLLDKLKFKQSKKTSTPTKKQRRLQLATLLRGDTATTV